MAQRSASGCLSYTRTAPCQVRTAVFEKSSNRCSFCRTFMDSSMAHTPLSAVARAPPPPAVTLKTRSMIETNIVPSTQTYVVPLPYLSAYAVDAVGEMHRLVPCSLPKCQGPVAKEGLTVYTTYGMTLQTHPHPCSHPSLLGGLVPANFLPSSVD